MKSVFLIVLFYLTGLSATPAKIELAKRSILDDKVEILLPTDFEIMSEEMMQWKYPSEQRPTLVYTDETGGVNVAFNHTTSTVEEAEFESLKNYLVSTMKNKYPTAKWKGTGIQTIHGRKVGYLELITPAIDTDIYNLLFFTTLDGRLLICTFNCVARKQKVWLEPAQEIMHSLTIKD
jgi:hypothetical protein